MSVNLFLDNNLFKCNALTWTREIWVVLPPKSGGSRTGGSRTGGSRTGGSRTGGSRTGGSQTGGSRTGGGWHRIRSNLRGGLRWVHAIRNIKWIGCALGGKWGVEWGVRWVYSIYSVPCLAFIMPTNACRLLIPDSGCRDIYITWESLVGIGSFM